MKIKADTMSMSDFNHAAVIEPTTINITVPVCLVQYVKDLVQEESGLELDQEERDEISWDFPVVTLSYDTRDNDWELQCLLIIKNKLPVHIETRNSGDESAFLYSGIRNGVYSYVVFSEREECIHAGHLLRLLNVDGVDAMLECINETNARTQHWTFEEQDVIYAQQRAMQELVKPCQQ